MSFELESDIDLRYLGIKAGLSIEFMKSFEEKITYKQETTLNGPTTRRIYYRQTVIVPISLEN